MTRALPESPTTPANAVCTTHPTCRYIPVCGCPSSLTKCRHHHHRTFVTAANSASSLILTFSVLYT
ncbi:hypothetical protein EI94DRAFT_1724635 [Lactarius quietus]|nr:hypothetical protein EI94DRAFT_1724635 [Lactarius quietus]